MLIVAGVGRLPGMAVGDGDVWGLGSSGGRDLGESESERVGLFGKEVGWGSCLGGEGEGFGIGSGGLGSGTGGYGGGDGGGGVSCGLAGVPQFCSPRAAHMRSYAFCPSTKAGASAA